MTPRSGSVRYALAGAFHSMAYVEWGDPAAPPVICVHGLTRNGRDFDLLAQGLADRFRVICPDLPGRGASDWLPDAALYQPPSYVSPLTHLIAAIGREVMWVGTSLGGIVGMLVASMPGQPITRLVLNDVGPFIPKAAIARIRDYLSVTAFGALTEFADVPALERHLRQVHAPFGPLTDAQWAHLARYSAKTQPDGRVAMHYDPKITVPFCETEPADADLWALWPAVSRIPVLAIRGASSDVLPAEVLARMQETGAQALVVAEAGHAPALMDTAQIAAVRRFLADG